VICRSDLAGMRQRDVPMRILFHVHACAMANILGIESNGQSIRFPGVLHKKPSNTVVYERRKTYSSIQLKYYRLYLLKNKTIPVSLHKYWSRELMATG
jgi:hypothetical protein